MKLTPADRKYIAETLPTVEGWLLDDSALLTSALVRLQASEGIAGGVFEIGVYAGKYLSLFYHLTQQTTGRVLGLDTFEWYPRDQVEKTFVRLFENPDRLSLITGDSTRIRPAEVLEPLGGKPRFISVDGAHTSAAVLSDLKLCQEVLAPGGIVAIDDIFNPRAIGVSEGAYRYFLGSEKDGLVPFAFCANKLYAAHRNDAPAYNGAVWQFTRANPDLEVAAAFDKLLAKGRDWVQQMLLGFPVVIL